MIRTSNFKNSGTDPDAVCISIGLPRWVKFTGKRYGSLAPTRAMLHLSQEGYHEAFLAILAKLDPATVIADLGPNAILICFEKPGDRCHRRHVAEWLEPHLGYDVLECGQTRAETGRYDDMKRATPAKGKTKAAANADLTLAL